MLAAIRRQSGVHPAINQQGNQMNDQPGHNHPHQKGNGQQHEDRPIAFKMSGMTLFPASALPDFAGTRRESRQAPPPNLSRPA
jgi:hypothetical protein